jgi:CBS domain-containing protein
MNARDIMTAHEVWACPETSNAQEVARMMLDHNVGAIPVLDSEGRLEGIITDRDMCCKLVAEGRSIGTPVREFMSEPAYRVYPETSIQEIESIMRRFKIRRLPVVDDEQKLQGFISIGDLAHYCNTAEDEHEFVGVMETVCASSM